MTSNMKESNENMDIDIRLMIIIRIMILLQIKVIFIMIFIIYMSSTYSKKKPQAFECIRNYKNVFKWWKYLRSFFGNCKFHNPVCFIYIQYLLSRHKHNS